MDKNDPIAFLSYVQNDDHHDYGRITALRERLEGEVRMHTGKQFTIFQDKKDIAWGQRWKERIESSLLNVTFLIPIITPAYFLSRACRYEFEQFLLREEQLGKSGLIMPVYYLYADQMEENANEVSDDIAKVLASRHWADWRNLRFKDLKTPELGAAVSEMAKTIKAAMQEMRSIIRASEAPQPITREFEHLPVSLATFSESTTSIRDGSGRPKITRPESAYYCYTKQFDIETSAKELSDADELARLNAPFKAEVSKRRKKNLALIQRLSVALKSVEYPVSSSVTFLLDNSGSMRGAKILETAAWTYIFTTILEANQIPTQVLGFTTRAWKGGLSREAWIKDGKPSRPGRLNDLRHIIYKSFSEKTKDVSAGFALMLREGILKENIDGEALLWSYRRAAEHGSDRMIIIVLSDGAPVDDSTLSVNSGNFLGQHLRATIKWLAKKTHVEIFGVGVEYDSGQYYDNGVSVGSASDVGKRVLEFLPGWLMNTQSVPGHQTFDISSE